MEHFKHVINMVFSVLFTIHVWNLISNIINPLLPEIKKYKRNLQEIEFPITFRICFNQKDNQGAFSFRRILKIFFLFFWWLLFINLTSFYNMKLYFYTVEIEIIHFVDMFPMFSTMNLTQIRILGTVLESASWEDS